ncbi:MAG: Gfo/Idh/MocA family oxidoreductase [Bacteriovoracaceae bacterium]
MSKVRVAVLGYGHLGKWHCQKAEAHSDKAEFVAIVEKFPAGQELARQNHPNVKVVSDIDEVINEIDAAVIVTPTSTHFELVSKLLQAGKHVFCEKPLCSNDEEALKLREIAANSKLVLQVGHSERFHQAWELLSDDLKNLKAPYTVRINRVAAFKGRATDVDVVQDLGIHDLDLVMYLLNEKPVSITAQGYKIRTDKWDHAHLDVELTNGSRAYVSIGRNGVKEIRDVEIMSASGCIYIDLFTNKIMKGSSSTFSDGSFVQEFDYPKRDHLLLEHGHFYDSILNDKPAVITLEDGLNAVHLVDCALKSLATNSKVNVKF